MGRAVWFWCGLRFGVRPDFTAAVWWRFSAQCAACFSGALGGGSKSAGSGPGI